MVLLQCGAHMRVLAKRAIEEIGDPVLKGIREMRSSCKFKFDIKFVWSEMNRQSKELDAVYPDRAESFAVKLNSDMSDYVNSLKDFQYEQLDVLNMTKGAEVSDGYHYLTEVNMLRPCI